MKFIASLLFILLVPSSANEIINKQHNNSFILSNINIVDVENQTIIPSKRVVIYQGKINSIIDEGSLLSFPNLQVIDGKNGYITPGLIDMHVHMYEKAAYILTLSHGVTHVRVMNGIPEQLLWRDNIKSGEQIGSTSTVSSPIISGYKGAYLHHGVDTANEARTAVKKYHEMGYDLIKAYGNLNKESLSAIASEGRKLGIPIAKHGPHASGNMPVSQLSGFQSFEHVEDIYQGPLNYEFAPERLTEIAINLKATNVAVTPTLNIYDQLTRLSHEKEKYLAKTSKHYTSDIIALETSNNQVKRWLSASDKMAAHNQKTLRFLQDIASNFHKNGISLLIGSDSGVLLSPHGLATHNEMRLLQEAGLSTFDVLASATINPAKALKLDKQIGKISENYNADFIYSSTNPILNLSILKNPLAVIKNGHWYSKKMLKTMRAEAIESRSIWEELSVLYEAL